MAYLGRLLHLLAICVQLATFQIARSLDEGDFCRLENRQRGVCRQLNDCPAAIKDLSEDKQKSPLLTCSKKLNGVYIICCDEGQVTSLPEITTTPLTYECGKAVDLQNAEPFIINGSPVQFGAFPWHVGIYNKSKITGEWDFQCGGSIISPKIVLSAAHCFKHNKILVRGLVTENIKYMRIGVGKKFISLNDKRDEPFAQDVGIKKVYIHPDWEGSHNDYVYDISIVTLDRQVNFNAVVQPICLDLERDPKEEKDLLGKIGMVPGWGKTEKQMTSEQLLVVEIPYVDRTTCRDEISLPLYDYVKRDKMCGGDLITKQTVCNGDSGGGYVFKDPRTSLYTLRGIVSLGTAGCKGDDYVIFTKVAEYSKLIKEHLKS